MRRSIVGVLIASSLILAPFAHAETNFFASQPNFFTATFNTWQQIATGWEHLADDIASLFFQQPTVATHQPQKPHAPKQLQAALTASAAAAVAPVPQSAVVQEIGNDISGADASPQSRSPPPVSQQLQNSPEQIQAPAFDASAFVTRNQFTDAIATLGASVQKLLTQNETDPLPPYVAADGNGVSPYAAGSAINTLTNVTISNPTITGLTASEIPDLSGSYLSLGGGAVTGTTSFATSLGIGTSSPSDIFAVNGPIFLGAVSPSQTTSRLYNTGGSLYWNGSLLGGASVGNWATDGTNVWRAGGNVGIGTTSPATTLSVAGNGYFTGNLVASGNTTLGNATSTNFFAMLANFTTGIINSLSGTNLTYTNATTTSLFVNSVFSSPNATIGALTATNTLAVLGNTTLANATSTNFFATTASSTNLFAQTASLGTLSAGTLALTNATTTSLFVKSQLSSPNATIGALTATGTVNFTGLGSGFVGSNGGSLYTFASSSIYAASSTLLTDSNTFSGSDIFSSLLNLNGGLIAYASSTIGNGTQAGGLTINGGATTTANTTLLGQLEFTNSTGAYPGATLSVTAAANSGQLFVNFPGQSGLVGTLDNYLTLRFNGAQNKLYFGADNSNAYIQTGLSHNMWFSPGAGGVSSTTAPTLVLTTTGNVGIGTTSPTSLLSLQGTDTTNGQFRIGYDNNDFAKLIVDSSGNLAINATTTTGNSASLTAPFRQANFGVAAVSLGSAGNGYPGVGYNVAFSAGAANAYTYRVGDSAFRIGLGGSAGNAITFNTAPAGTAGNTISWTTPLTLTSGGASTTALTVSGNSYFPGSGIWNSSGLVGIGTTSPATTLSVAGNGYLTGGLGVGLLNTTAGTLQTIGNATIGGTLALTGTTGTTTIASGQGFTIGGSQFVVQQGSGNVGIGTTTPARILDIFGNTGSTATGIRLECGILCDGTQYDSYSLVVGSAGSDVFSIKDDVAGLQRLAINSLGNVGIGTTSPNTPLSVSTANSAVATLEDSSGGGGDWTFYVGASGSTIGGNNFGIGPIGTSANSKVVIQNGGNVGIGTTTPGSLLSVGNGNGINFSTATSTFSTTGGINLAAGCFAISGNCLSLGSLGLTGTTGQVPYFSGTNTAVGTSSLFIASSGWVGIGTTTPGYKLDSYDATQAYSGIFYGNNSGGGAVALGGFNGLAAIQGFTNDSATAGADLVLQPTGSARKVGIGTTTPQSKLSVAGNASIGADYDFAAPTNGLLVEGNVGIGTTSPATTLSVAGNGYLTGGLGVGVTNAGAGTLQTSGNAYFGANVGIGTVSPNRLLEIYDPANTGAQLRLTTASGNTGIELLSGGAHYNWQVGAQNEVNNGFTITPSTASGGTTFTTPAFTVLNTGNVGIGTTTPGSLLSVGNTNGINFSTATSSFSTTGGINLAAGCFAISGNCLTLGSLGLTGTTGQVPYFSGTNTAVGTSSLFIASSGNVGIGTTTPAHPLDVFGNGNGNQMLIEGNANNVGLGMQDYQTGGDTWFFSVSGGSSSNASSFNFYNQNLNSTPLQLNNNGDVGIGGNITNGSLAGANMVIKQTNGNVGIGTTTPSNTLDVFGNSNGNQLLVEGNANNVGMNIQNYGAGGDAFSIDSTDNSSSIGGGKFDISGPNTSSNFLTAVYSSGNVGIGTTSPATTLSVAGNSYLTGGLGVGLLNTSAGTLSLLSASNQIQLAGTDSPSSPATLSMASSLLTITGGNNGVKLAANGPGANILIADGNNNIAIATPNGGAYATINGLTALGAGNVGIGTTNPGALGSGLLTVAGTGNNPIINASTTDVTTGSVSSFNAYSDSSLLAMSSHGSARTVSRYGLTLGGWTELSDWNNLGTTNGLILGTIPAVPIVFGTNTAERMRITSGGLVGIGTTSPATTLSVAGNGYLTGGLGVGVVNTTAGVLQTSGNAMIGNNLSLSTAGTISTPNNTVPITINGGAAGGGNPAVFIQTQGANVATFSNYSGASASTLLNGSGNTTYPTLLVVAGGSNAASVVSVKAGNTSAYLQNWQNSSGNVLDAINSSGNLGINTTNPGNYLAISTSTNLGTISEEYNGASQYAGGFNNNDTGSANQTVFNFLRNATQVGTVSETNTATAYNTTSDRRVKENIVETQLGLDQLMQLPVRSFDFIKDPTHATTTGFIAQELEPIFPWAVSTNGDNGLVPLGPTSTPWSVDYGRITPLIVKAVQDIANITSSFQTNLIAWLGNAENGIAKLFAGEVDTQKLCVNDGPNDQSPICVTKTQLAALLSQSASAATPESVTSSAVPSATSSAPSAPQNSTPTLPESATSATSSASQTATPPVLQVNGANPAIIQLGAAYNDLGATITGPQQDLNLGITTYVNGTEMNPVQIDTSTAATDTIDYVATDQNGLTSTSTRVVIVEPAESPSIIPAAAASSTAATSTSS
jgi:hypothetical protein